MNDPKNDPRLVEAFQLMWGNFPDPMMLVHKDRTILAVNDACAKQGAAVGTKCFSYNPVPGDVEHGACKACQANKALKAGCAVACDGEFAGGQLIRGYWIPVKGSSEVYLHGYSPLKPTLPAAA
ncbi:MAG TPA: hypothetical protein VD838_07345 [Anaeromyxobacteraceae bacterium]|nr:hypothetical protein [Anaeromyxobacteraceae bacterium]